MDRFSDESMKRIREKMRDRLISLGYDDSRLFVDGSNFYTYMEENVRVNNFAPGEFVEFQATITKI